MKKRKFAIEKPKEFQENTYIGTLGELQQIVQEQDEEVVDKTPETTTPSHQPQGKKTLSGNTPQHKANTPVTGKRILPKMKRKVDPMHIPIRSEKKPVKKEKRKKRGLVWFVICLLFVGFYVASFEVARYTFPKSTTIAKIYYPVTTLNKHITILPTIQKSILSLYKKIGGK